MKVKFKQWDCTVRWALYGNGNTAIELIGTNGERITKATVNTGALLMETEVAIKNYSENEGMLDALLAAGIILPPHDEISCGFVTAPVCLLTQKANIERKKWSDSNG